MWSNGVRRVLGESLEHAGNKGARRVFWFIALWCLGVAGAALLALPFEILMRVGMH